MRWLRVKDVIKELSLEKVCFLADEEATEALGAAIGVASAADGLIFLQGNLGAGKTTFSRGVLRGLGHKGRVKSPTYTLVEPYSQDGWQVYHFDLYRLSDAEELEYMGMRDFLDERSLCLVEWPEKGEGFLPTADLMISLQTKLNGREACLVAQTDKGRKMLENLTLQERIVMKS
jgi:tRNA threonylcarbamoyladenosine biosynthesis protein TsaE